MIFDVLGNIWHQTACPQVFSIWGYMYPFTFIFGGAMYPLTLHLGVQRKLTAFSPRKVVHHAVFCKYYAELAKTLFFCLTLGMSGSRVLSDPWPFVSVPPFFCNIVFNLSNFVFLYRTESKITYILSWSLNNSIKCFSVYIFLSKKIRQIWSTICI